MKKVKLGVSLYPEQETTEQIDHYLKTASGYGFENVFTSLFSVNGTREEVVAYFKKLTDIAHTYGMKVSGDCNSGFFQKYGATPEDLSLFREMGIDILRIDFCFRDERDAALINNQQGIGIEMSSAMPDAIAKAIENGADPKRITAVHNFYPQRYTGISSRAVRELNSTCQKLGVGSGIFVTSTQPGTHGPWPVSDGLPTMEMDRTLPIALQVKHCLALDNIDEIYIGDAFATDEELRSVAEVMQHVYTNVPRLEGLDPSFAFIADFLPHGDLKRIPLDVELVAGLNATEQEIILQYPVHSVSPDSSEYMLRSRWTRILYGRKEIPCRRTCQKMFHRGDVVIVNDNLKHYRGEVQIILQDMAVDGQRNLVGRIAEDELFLLELLQDSHDFANAKNFCFVAL